MSVASVFDDIENESGKPRLLTKADMRQRMMKLVPKAWRCLEENLYSEDDKVAVTAALGILDRCGFGPQSKVTVEDISTDLTNLSDEQLRQRALDIAAQIAQNAPRNGTYDEPFEKSIH